MTVPVRDDAIVATRNYPLHLPLPRCDGRGEDVPPATLQTPATTLGRGRGSGCRLARLHAERAERDHQMGRAVGRQVDHRQVREAQA